jgi:hypothetical protein
MWVKVSADGKCPNALCQVSDDIYTLVVPGQTIEGVIVQPEAFTELLIPQVEMFGGGVRIRLITPHRVTRRAPFAAYLHLAEPKLILLSSPISPNPSQKPTLKVRV